MCVFHSMENALLEDEPRLRIPPYFCKFCSTAAGFLFRGAIAGLRKAGISQALLPCQWQIEDSSLILKMDEVISVQVQRELYSSDSLIKAISNKNKEQLAKCMQKR